MQKKALERYQNLSKEKKEKNPANCYFLNALHALHHYLKKKLKFILLNKSFENTIFKVNQVIFNQY